MGYELTRFQGDVDEELVCPICSGVLEEPVQVIVDCRLCMSGYICGDLFFFFVSTLRTVQYIRNLVGWFFDICCKKSRILHDFVFVWTCEVLLERVCCMLSVLQWRIVAVCEGHSAPHFSY